MEDAVTAAPNIYKVLSENDRVRVLEVKMKPGDKTQMHSHPDLVACAVIGGRFKFTSPDSQSMEAEMKTGQSMYFEAADHATENIGGTETHIILIELK